MRKAKALTLIVALLVSALAIQSIFPPRVHAADALQDTLWADWNFELSFKKGGKVELNADDGFEARGTYKLNGVSVEMTFDDGMRGSATIREDKMSIKLKYPGGKTGDFVLVKESS